MYNTFYTNTKDNILIVEDLKNKLTSALEDGKTTRTEIYKKTGITFATLKGVERLSLNITLKTYNRLNDFLGALK